MNETDYRKRIQETYDLIDQALSEIDPDVAECEQSLGSMTITFSDQSRCILSSQPSVRQLWLALASKGTAYHFDYQEEFSRWVDDKGRGIEIIGFLESFLSEKLGRSFKIQRDKQ